MADSYSELQPNEAVFEIANSVRKELEDKVELKFVMYTPVLYRTQVVNGLNYLIKVQTDTNVSCHILVHVPPGSQSKGTLSAYRFRLPLYQPLDPILPVAPPR